MVPVMAGVTLSFKMRKQPRVGLVYVGDGATSTGAFHEGSTSPRCSAARWSSSSRTTATRTRRRREQQTAAKQLVDKAIGYGIPGVQADGNDVLAVYRRHQATPSTAPAGARASRSSSS